MVRVFGTILQKEFFTVESNTSTYSIQLPTELSSLTSFQLNGNILEITCPNQIRRLVEFHLAAQHCIPKHISIQWKSR
ncbi:MAG: hypothetical protein QM538_06865 [Methylacidiphilales bacterium]|nr:hypothetical protein [Candidatus Methylacidiphilales bacterium]